MKQQKIVYFTQQGYQQLHQQKAQLEDVRKTAVEELSRARAMGDLSENGFYKSAKMKLSSIDHKLRETAYLLKFGRVKENRNVDSIDIGSRISITDGSGKKTFVIVGGYESNPTEGKLSHLSPLGKALIGNKVGQSVIIQTPSGKKIWRILSIN